MSKPVDFCKRRMRHLLQLMDEYQIDLVYLVKEGRSSPLYHRIADTPSGNAFLIPRDGEPVLFCYPVDYVSIKDESWIPVRKLESRERSREQIVDYSNEHLKKGESKIGVNLDVMNHTDYIYYCEKMNGELEDINSSIIPEVFFGLYPEEVEYQREVSRLADIAVTAAKEAMAPGLKEYEVAAEANYAMMKEGAEMQSFPTIISSGERSAYCHGWPGERVLKKDDLVIVDLGPMKHGYAADETRTFLIGENDKKEKMLRAVDKSVQAVIDNLQLGVSCKELDAISRRALKKEGFGDYPHTLGHPISGFVVPRLAKNTEHVLKRGMLFTIEPGIYIAGYGGVRLEENVVITEDGYEKLTNNPRLYI